MEQKMSKPWVTPELRALLKERRRAYVSGEREEQKRVQHELKYKIRQAKNSYSRKLEERLENNNVRGVWRSLKTITGHGQRADTVASDEDQGLANELNLFFNRFDSSPPPLRFTHLLSSSYTHALSSMHTTPIHCHTISAPHLHPPLPHF
ncbi:uncharacterized protein LOC144989091 [Oryzias latipes]